MSKDELKQAFSRAAELGLFDLPGLESANLLWGVKGEEQDQPAALWVYESRQAWEQLWGTPEAPVNPANYPEAWLRWEEEVLKPLIVGEPDKVPLTSYQVLASTQK